MINASLLLGFSSGCQNSSNWWRRAGYKFLLVESRHKAACCQRKQDGGGHGPQWPMTEACIKSVEDMNQDKILSKATENWEKVGGMRTKKKKSEIGHRIGTRKGMCLKWNRVYWSECYGQANQTGDKSRKAKPLSVAEMRSDDELKWMVSRLTTRRRKRSVWDSLNWSRIMHSSSINKKGKLETGQ